MADQDLYDLIAQADPETLKLMMGAGLVPAQIGAMERQPTAEGRTVGPHNVYVAASPLEHLANAFRGVREQQMIGQQGRGREAYLRLLAGNGRPPQPPPALPGQPGYDASAGFDDPANYG